MDGEGDKNKGGKPRFVPTAAQRELVKTLAGMGIKHEQIALVVKNPATGKPVTAKTLRRSFRAELDEGIASSHSRCAIRIAQLINSRNENIASRMAIFYAKTRMKWKETDALEVTGKDGAPLMDVAAMTDAEKAAAISKILTPYLDKLSKDEDGGRA